MIPAFNHYYDELKKQFHQLYNDLLQDCDSETVHAFRLNLKRQLGFYRLLELLMEDFEADKAFAQYLDLYKMAGKVRDIQVEKKVVSKDEGHLLMEKRFTHWLGEQEDVRKEQLQLKSATASLAPIHQLENEISLRLQALNRQALNERLPRYFSTRLRSLRKHVKQHKKCSLHDLRKEVKELFYNLQLLDRLLDTKTLSAKTLSTLDYWQTLLGRWHDYDFILARIKEKKEPCPKAVRKQYETRHTFFVKEIVRRKNSLLVLLKQLEKDLEQLWTGMISANTPPPRRHFHPSVSQKNIREGYL